MTCGEVVQRGIQQQDIISTSSTNNHCCCPLSSLGDATSVTTTRTMSPIVDPVFYYCDSREVEDSRPRTLGVVTLSEAVEELFQLLTDDQLQTLVDLVCNRTHMEDCDAGPCVTTTGVRHDCSTVTSSRRRRLHHRTRSRAGPHVMSCMLWRWPELSVVDNDVDDSSDNRLIPMPSCYSTDSASSVCCCNPYHWARLQHLPSQPRTTTTPGLCFILDLFTMLKSSANSKPRS